MFGEVGRRTRVTSHCITTLDSLSFAMTMVPTITANDIKFVLTDYILCETYKILLASGEFTRAS